MTFRVILTYAWTFICAIAIIYSIGLVRQAWSALVELEKDVAAERVSQDEAWALRRVAIGNIRRNICRSYIVLIFLLVGLFILFTPTVTPARIHYSDISAVDDLLRFIASYLIPLMFLSAPVVHLYIAVSDEFDRKAIQYGPPTEG